MHDFILGGLMEEVKKNLDNPNQCKSIYTILKEFIISIYIKIKSFIVEWWLMILIASIALIIISSFGYFYFSKHNLIDVSKKVDELGQMGDFFGGIINPTLAFLSFCLLLITIKIQSKELKSSTEELKKSSKALKKQSKSLKIQNFETTFFNLINLHNKLVDNFNFKKYSFNFLHNNKLNFDLRESNIFYKEEAFNEICKDIDLISKNDNLNFTKLNEVYDLYYIEKQHVLNKYFDNIHQIFKFISDSKFNENEKKKYSDIFRVQFSQDELKLLFYHCIGDRGSVILKPYIEKFRFFEFLILEEENKIFLFILNKSIYDSKAFGDNFLELDNTIESENEYIEKTKLINIPWKYFENSISYCLYLFTLEKYDLILKKFEELEIELKKIVKCYNETANISYDTKKDAEKKLSMIMSFRSQIRKYLNTSSQEQQ
jgi:hypothetical protein